MRKLSNFQPVKEIPQTLVQVPGFIQGDFLEAFIPAYTEATQGNPYLSKLQDGKGSSPLISGLVNKVLSSTSFRVATPTDNVYDKILPLVKGKYYTDLNAFDVWEQSPSFTQNEQLWKDVIALAREQKGSDVDFPFRLQGFYVTPEKSSGGVYRVKVEAAPNIRVIEDKRLGLPSETRFDKLDENGMIVQKENGKFAHFSIGNGLSAVCLNNLGYLYAYYYNLGNSNASGRVVVVDAEGVSVAQDQGGKK